MRTQFSAVRAAFVVSITFLTALGSTPGHALPISEIENNDFRGQAQNVDAFFSDQSFNPNIFRNDSDDSSAPPFPSVSIAGTLGNIVNVEVDAFDFYSFTGAAGNIAFFDIDAGTGTGIENLDPYLSLFDANGTLLAVNNSEVSDPGSTSELDSFIGNYTLSTNGLYYVVVSDAADTPNQLDNPDVIFSDLIRPDGEFGGATTDNTVFGDDSFAGGELENSGSYTFNISVQNAPGNPAAVPEPGTMALMGVGLASLVGLRRRKKDASHGAITEA